MRSYLFEPTPLAEKSGSAVSIDEAEDYDYDHLEGVAKEYAPQLDPIDDPDFNPLRRSAILAGRKIQNGSRYLWRRVLGMSRKQQIIAILSTVAVAVVLGFTLGYLTPDDEDTPYPASYYHKGYEKESYEVTQENKDDQVAAAYVSSLATGDDGSQDYSAMPDAPVAAQDDEVSTSGFFSGLFGLGNLFGSSKHYTISEYQYEHLQELALLNNVAYCVPMPGITAPFNCTRACEIFSPGVEIITTFTNTELDSSCTGYLAVDHRPGFERILLVFRGTNSMTDWYTNLDTIQESYPANRTGPICPGCYVHRGFLHSYLDSKILFMPELAKLKELYPEYSLLVSGHSLGGAIAVLAGAELLETGYYPEITTFGQPRVGNSYFADYFDYLVLKSGIERMRVTHKSDPVPQVPLGVTWRHSGGEIYIAKGPLSPAPEDCYICDDQEDGDCSAGEGVVTTLAFQGREVAYRAHVEYFTRVGLCRFQI
ncbi:Alpha/Beta hydrolase protein [Kockiozyma suomiensis]|uniref:Alpha/Beta hydrolase protein n=1 Tax=Kockiozyma suomiensis TaxID=1337062 RepID=UPI003343BD83